MAASADDRKVRYAVTTTISGENAKATKDEYVAWLENGHAEALVTRGGALSAEVVVESGVDEAGPFRVQSLYVFPNMAAYTAYTEGVAKELRKDGLARFGPESGKQVAFARFLGYVTWSSGD